MTTTDNLAQLDQEEEKVRQEEAAIRLQAVQNYLDGTRTTLKLMNLAMVLDFAAAAAFVYFLLDGPKSDGVLLFLVGAAICGELTVIANKLGDISRQLTMFNIRK